MKKVFTTENAEFFRENRVSLNLYVFSVNSVVNFNF